MEYVYNLLDKLAEVERQRDELAKALRGLVEAQQMYYDDDVRVVDAKAKARAALAKVEG